MQGNPSQTRSDFNLSQNIPLRFGVLTNWEINQTKCGGLARFLFELKYNWTKHTYIFQLCRAATTQMQNNITNTKSQLD